MTAIFPTLPGLGWSVTKSARFATRIQRAVNGRELRALDQPYPIWSWTLTYPLLRDKWDSRSGGPGTGRAITADSTYWSRVRFWADPAEFENFMLQLWQARQIKLQSVLL